MPINIMPHEIAEKIAPKETVERLITQRLTVNKAILTLLADQKYIPKQEVTDVALKVLKQYKEKYKLEIKDGEDKSEALSTAVNDKKLIVQRVQQVSVFEIVNTIKKKYQGLRYIWLPSDANVPDPLHQLNYGKRFTVGVGEMPADRYGCRCGMRILTTDEDLITE